MEDKGLNLLTFSLGNAVELKVSEDSTDPYNHLNFSKIPSKVAPGGKQQMALAASPTHLVMAAHTNGLLKYLRASKMA